MLAALVENQSESESLLLLIEKSSGSFLFPGYKMQHELSTSITTMAPLRYEMMHWSDASNLWILFGFEPTNVTATTERTALIQLHVNPTDNTISLVSHLKFDADHFPTVSHLYTDADGRTMLAIGATKRDFQNTFFWLDTSDVSVIQSLTYAYDSIYD
jgi:hypothetical protein